jgi:hypothetical protein
VNIADVKKKLSSDEKVLESVFKIEELYKKHKFKMWAIALALVVYFGGRSIQENIHEGKIMEANTAFMTLQGNAEDSKALAILKENNPALFELYSYSQAVKSKDKEALQALSSSKNAVVVDMSRYSISVLDRKPVDSVLYNELALFQEAYLAISEGNSKKAKAKLDLIDERAPLATITGFLKHSTIKAN